MAYSLWALGQDYYEQWGFDDPKLRSRVWARVPEIVHQEIPHPLLHATFIGIGAHCLAVFALSALGDLFSFNSPSIYYFLWWPPSFVFGLFMTSRATVSTCGDGVAGTPAAGFSVLLTGVCLCATFLFKVLPLYRANEFPGLRDNVDNEMQNPYKEVIVIFIAVVLTSFFFLWTVDRRRYRLTSTRSLSESESPRTATPLSPQSEASRTLSSPSQSSQAGPLRNESSPSNSVSPGAVLASSFRSMRSSMLAMTILMAVEGVHAVVSLLEYTELGMVTFRNALTVIVLALSVIITVNCVNASLVIGHYAWRWRAISTTAIPVAILHAGVFVSVNYILRTEKKGFVPVPLVSRVCPIGAAGSLGAEFAFRMAQQYVYSEQELKEIYKSLLSPRPARSIELQPLNGSGTQTRAGPGGVAAANSRPNTGVGTRQSKV